MKYLEIKWFFKNNRKTKEIKLIQTLSQPGYVAVSQSPTELPKKIVGTNHNIFAKITTLGQVLPCFFGRIDSVVTGTRMISTASVYATNRTAAGVIYSVVQIFPPSLWPLVQTSLSCPFLDYCFFRLFIPVLFPDSAFSNFSS